MGYDFKNINGEAFRFNIGAWSRVLELAHYFGWQPMGTTLRDFTVRVPDGLDISNEQYIRETVERWDGEYCANEWQLVEEEDALNLAFALMIAVKALPDEDDDSKIVQSIDHWSGKDNKKILKDFIKYCMGGEFDIL
tara:strand:- start:488 stop:898 length:411 start_codon:yes stop_codon:yes gene_type:complete